MKNKSRKEVLFDIANYIVLGIYTLITVYPFINTAAYSLSEGSSVNNNFYIWPSKFSMDSFRAVFSDNAVLWAYYITIGRTILGTLTGVMLTGLFAYVLSRKELIGRKFYILMCTFTLFFSGGLIPYYLLLKNLKLTNNFLVYVIPGIISVYNMILMKNYFLHLPAELEESARIDGAGYLKTFMRIILPVSKPIIATISIFVAVGHWNSYFDGFLYVTDERLYPIQTYLYKIIRYPSSNIIASEGGTSITYRTYLSAELMLTLLPVVLLYSFFSRYFKTGIMTGALKY